MEGKVEHKFDMKPHHANIEEYQRMCRERTNKSMVKNRQIQVTPSLRFFLFAFHEPWFLSYANSFPSWFCGSTGDQ